MHAGRTDTNVAAKRNAWSQDAAQVAWRLNGSTGVAGPPLKLHGRRIRITQVALTDSRIALNRSSHDCVKNKFQTV
jgi:hypothetical protein